MTRSENPTPRRRAVALELAARWRRLRRARLPQAYKRELAAALLKLALAGRRRPGGGAGGTMNLAGYRVAFLNLEALDYAFNEIFVRLDYYFETGVERPLIVDCGSNIGLSILFFKKLYPRARVVGFEPSPRTFEVLEENIRANALEDVQVHNQALAAAEGPVEFFYDPEVEGSLQMSTLTARMSSRAAIRVAAVPLSRFIEREVDFLKLDVEGAETEVVGELGARGKLRNIRQMLIEYHHHVEAGDDALAAMLGLLEEAGFGYQISGELARPLARDVFQDLLIYAYQRRR